MTVKRIDHIGIVVKDLADGVATFEQNFGFTADPTRGGELPALGIKNVFVPLGASDLEFIEPTTDEGPVAKFAQERGEGQFLLALEVDDIAATIEHLRSLGVRTGDPSPSGVAYVSMKSTFGVNLQLVQRS